MIFVTTRPCDNVWSVSGFKPRFMHNDVVVTDQRFGPEVKGRSMLNVVQELTERLCTDPALLYDLESYNRGGFGFSESAEVRSQHVLALSHGFRDAWRVRVIALLGVINTFGKPHLEKFDAAYSGWYYLQGSSPAVVPSLAVGKATLKRSDLLVYFAHGQRRALRLQCGFQPFE